MRTIHDVGTCFLVATELAVCAAEMTELMSQHGTELLQVERLHQRQTKDQMIVRPAKDAEARALHDCRVELVDERTVCAFGARALLRTSSIHANSSGASSLAIPTGVTRNIIVNGQREQRRLS